MKTGDTDDENDVQVVDEGVSSGEETIWSWEV